MVSGGRSSGGGGGLKGWSVPFLSVRGGGRSEALEPS